MLEFVSTVGVCVSHSSVTLTAALHRLLGGCKNTFQLCDKLAASNQCAALSDVQPDGDGCAAEVIGDNEVQRAAVCSLLL